MWYFFLAKPTHIEIWKGYHSRTEEKRRRVRCMYLRGFQFLLSFSRWTLGEVRRHTYLVRPASPMHEVAARSESRRIWGGPAKVLGVATQSELKGMGRGMRWIWTRRNNSPCRHHPILDRHHPILNVLSSIVVILLICRNQPSLLPDIVCKI